MSSPMFSVKLPYKVRCSLPECGKPINFVFKKELDGIMCNFCSPHHARVGEQRWQEKKDKNIHPGVPVKEEEQEMIGDNIEEIE